MTTSITTQPSPSPVGRTPRGTSVSAQPQPEKEQDGTGHLNGRLGSITTIVLATLAALLVTALMRIAV